MITRRDMLRAGIALPMTSASGTAMAQPAALAWLYSDPKGSAAIRRESDGRWTEFTSSGEQWMFRELGRNGRSIELRDDSRGMQLRLHDNFGEWRRDPERSWHRWVTGRWVPEETLPPLIDYRIRLAYFIPSDRVPLPNYEAKIAVLMSFVTDIYNQSLQGHGHPVRSLPLRTRGGKPDVALIRSAKPAAYYNRAPDYQPNTVDHWRRIVADIPANVGVPQKQLLLVFTETFGEGPATLEWSATVARAARYTAAGGVGVFSAWILRDEFCALSVAEQRRLFFDETPIVGRVAMGSRGRPNSPRHFFIEDGFGAVAHELGHALGLAHDLRQPFDIMGYGFRRIRWNFADPPQPKNGGMFSEDNIRVLLCSRFLATDLDMHDLTPPKVNLRIVAAKQDARPVSVTIELDTSDERGLRAVVFYSVQNDCVIGGRWLSGARQSFREELTIDASITGPLAVEATVMDVGGNYTIKRATWPA